MKKFFTALVATAAASTILAQDDATKEALNIGSTVAAFKCTTMAHVAILATPAYLKALKLTTTQKAALSKSISGLVSTKKISSKQAEQTVADFKAIFSAQQHSFIASKTKSVEDTGACELFYGKNTFAKLLDKLITSTTYNPFYHKNMTYSTALKALKALEK